MLTAAKAQLTVCLNLTRAISQTRTVEEIYATALDALEDGLGVSRSSILLFDPDGLMRFKASRGLSDEYRRAVEGHTPWTPESPDPQPIVVASVMEEPTLKPLLPAVLDEGIGAMVFVPLVSLGRVIGKFMLYYDAPHVPTSDELQLASVIASQVAFAVERTGAEDQVRRSGERLQFALDAANMGTWDWDLRTQEVRWSENLERVHGLAPGSFGGTFENYEREIHPDDRERVFASIQRAVTEGVPHDVEYRIVGGDGSVRWVEGKGTVEYGPDGSAVRLSGVCMNVTSRKEAELARLDAIDRLTTLVTASASLLNAPDTQAIVEATIATAQSLLVADGYAVWVSDPADRSWRVISSAGVSERFAHRIVRSSDAAASAASSFPRPLAVPDVRSDQLLQEQIVAYQEEGIAAMLVCPMQLGPERAATLVFYYRNPRGFGAADIEAAQTLANLAAAAMSTADLHEQLRAERNAVEAARSRAAFLADATAILSRSLDYEKTLAAVARLAVPEMADWCAVDILGEDGQLKRLAVAHIDREKIELARALQERYPSDPDTPGGIHDVIRTGKPAMMEFIPPELIVARARNAEHLRLLQDLALTSYMCVPLLSASGTLGAITFVYAESGRRYAPRDLAFAQELSARASLAIENAFAYRRVNEASRVKDEFLATLSHELRTPLNAILGYAQMLDTGVLAGDAHAKAIRVLARNAHALKQIIDDVLDIARITSGKLRLNACPVELGEILRNALATVQPAADARDVSLQLALEAPVAPVLGDADRLQQVVWNLLSNAVKFTPRGGHVQLKLREDHAWIEVAVRDDGQGIDRAFLPHLFERFRQADSRFSREHAGLGLGLAIVRELVELHGGTVSASSDGAGTGAAFTVRLPALSVDRATSSGGRETRAAAAPPASGPVPQALKGRRILAVDNEEDALGLLRVILESAGAHVTTAGSAPRALALLQRDRFDALIADIGMPGVDGLEFIRSVRQSLPAPANRVPAAALTAYARSEDRVSALDNGYQVHIAKPVDPADLVTTVAALVGSPSGDPLAADSAR